MITRMFSGIEIMMGIKAEIVSPDVLTGRRQGTFDERMRLEQFLNAKSNVDKEKRSQGT